MTWTEFITAQCAGGQRDQTNEDRIKTFNGMEGNQTHTYLDFMQPGINRLNTKRNLLYIRNQFVPRSKHFPPRL